ncbi:MAG: hypothetical protein HRT54_08335 [Colwellia sp.]|nr:hypothetical protein [Colwellia sp.]
MSTLFFSFIRKVCLATALLAATNSQAGLIVESGVLIGATGIEIAGFGRYNVSFEDGSCAELFSGCDEITDFAFNDLDQVRAAGQALLEQIFIDSDLWLLDTDPTLTRGCEDDTKCIAFIPFKFLDNWVIGKNLINASMEVDDKHGYSTNLGIDQSIAVRSNTTFAVFTKIVQVPAPPSVLLFSSALIFLVSLKRKQSC